MEDVARLGDLGRDLAQPLVAVQHLARPRRDLGQGRDRFGLASMAEAPRARAKATVKQAKTASCVVNALVEATPISGPAKVGKTMSALRAMELPAG
jgi:hypothetical protein